MLLLVSGDVSHLYKEKNILLIFKERWLVNAMTRRRIKVYAPYQLGNNNKA